MPMPKTNLSVEYLLQEWKKDSIINESDLANEIIRVPLLHCKYLDYYIHFKYQLAQMEAKKNKLAWIKRKYFRGEMDQADLKKYGWSQWNCLKPSSAELNQLLEYDSDMTDIVRVISELKTAVSGCEYIMAQLKSREFSLKTIFEYQRYMGGN